MIRRLLIAISLGASILVAAAACTTPGASPSTSPLVPTSAPSDLPIESMPSESMLPSDSPIPSAS
jgi:hypothetical protein